jgi:hypothetical protein
MQSFSHLQKNYDEERFASCRGMIFDPQNEEEEDPLLDRCRHYNSKSYYTYLSEKYFLRSTTEEEEVEENSRVCHQIRQLSTDEIMEEYHKGFLLLRNNSGTTSRVVSEKQWKSGNVNPIQPPKNNFYSYEEHKMKRPGLGFYLN